MLSEGAMAPDEGRAGKIKRNMRAYRGRRRAQGLRLVQRWVPDTRSPEFLAEIGAQSRAVAAAADAESELLDWIESNADFDDWK
jgi:hypothetical protein